MDASANRYLPMDEQRDLRHALGGSLRASDVRRYFVEVMVAAMHADGHVDQRELLTLERVLDEHELFCALPPHVAKQLVLTGTDAVDYAADIFQRIPIIAQNLVSRSHRLFAFAMACEVIAADEAIAEAERHYLDELREGLMLTTGEHTALLAAASRGSAMPTAETLARNVTRWISPLVDMCILHAALARHLDTEALAANLCRLPDLQLHDSHLRAQLAHLPADVSSWSVTAKLAEVGQLLPTAEDRYWLATYVLAVDAMGASTGQRVPFFAATLERAFGLPGGMIARMTAHADAMVQRLVPC